MNEQINEQLVLLQEELARLKHATDYIDNAKTNATVIIQELEKVQQHYAQYTDELFALYKQSITDFKEDVETKIENDVQRIEDVGHRINATNQALAADTKNLLEQYGDVIDASNSLITALNTIDFHTKLEDIHTRTEQLSAFGTNFKQELELKISETQNLILEKSATFKSDIEQLILSEFKKTKELKKEHSDQNYGWHSKQENEMKGMKVYAWIICGLILLNMIIMMIK